MNKYYNEIVSEFTKYDEVIIEGNILKLTDENN